VRRPAEPVVEFIQLFIQQQFLVEFIFFIVKLIFIFIFIVIQLVF
jgi:hypothetical protein